MERPFFPSMERPFFPLDTDLATLSSSTRRLHRGHVIPVNIKLEKDNFATTSTTRTHKTIPELLVNDLQCKEKIAVKNIGKRDGEEVVMAYSKPSIGIVGTHMKQVVGFEKVFVETVKKTDARFELDVCQSFSIVDSVGYKVLPDGVLGVLTGDGDKAVALQVKISYH